MTRKLVRIGRVGPQGGALVPVFANTDVYTTSRRQARGGYRPAHSPAYEDTDVGRMEALWGSQGRRAPRVEHARDAERWDEQEVVPGLRIRVLRGQPWNAERLDTGQILLSPTEPTGRRPRRIESAGVGETAIGALFRDTDGFERVVPDPIPNGRGDRW